MHSSDPASTKKKKRTLYAPPWLKWLSNKAVCVAAAVSVSTLSGAILVLVTFLIFSHHLWSGQRLCLTFEAPSGGPLEEQQPAHLTFMSAFKEHPPPQHPTHTHTNALSRGTSTLRAGSSRPGVWCWHAGSAAVLGSPESWLASAACLYVYSCRLGWQRRADTCNLTCREWRWIVLLQTGQGLLSVGLCPVSLLHWVREQNPLKLLKKEKKVSSLSPPPLQSHELE